MGTDTDTTTATTAADTTTTTVRERIQYVVPLRCGHFVDLPEADHAVVHCPEGHCYEIARLRDADGKVYTIETRRIVQHAA